MFSIHNCVSQPNDEQKRSGYPYNFLRKNKIGFNTRSSEKKMIAVPLKKRYLLE